MRVSSNKILQKSDYPSSHCVVTLLSAQNLSDSNFSEAANTPMATASGEVGKSASNPLDSRARIKTAWVRGDSLQSCRVQRMSTDGHSAIIRHLPFSGRDRHPGHRRSTHRCTVWRGQGGWL